MTEINTASAIRNLRDHRDDILLELRDLGFTHILVPRPNASRTVLLVGTPDDHVEVADLYDAEQLLGMVAGLDVELVSIGTVTGRSLAQNADEL